MGQGQGTHSKGKKETSSRFSKQARVMQRQGNGGLECSECPGAGWWFFFSRATAAPGDAAGAHQGFGKRSMSKQRATVPFPAVTRGMRHQ